MGRKKLNVKKSSTLQFRIEEDLLSKWKEFCNKNSLNSSSWLRSKMLEEMGIPKEIPIEDKVLKLIKNDSFGEIESSTLEKVKTSPQIRDLTRVGNDKGQSLRPESSSDRTTLGEERMSEKQEIVGEIDPTKFSTSQKRLRNKDF